MSQAVFDESFRLAVASTKLDTKTLQISVYSRPATSDSHEECLVSEQLQLNSYRNLQFFSQGWAQVSLADFRPDTNSVKWYNIWHLDVSLLAAIPCLAQLVKLEQGLRRKAVTSQQSCHHSLRH